MGSELKAVQMKEDKMGKFDKWEVEDALRSLQRAEEVRKDEKLMKEVFKLARLKLKEIKSIADLKAAYHAQVEEEDE